MLDEDAPKIYGLDTVDTSKDIYVTEGPFDSTFLGNAIAMCGSDVDLSDWIITSYSSSTMNRGTKRSSIEFLRRSITGLRVVIFPNTVKEKDLE